MEEREAWFAALPRYAASRICNPQAAGYFRDAPLADALANAIRRYSKLQICATMAHEALMKPIRVLFELVCFSAALFALNVAAAPGILVAPQSVSQINAFPASFSVTATGAPPVLFQWRRGGTNQVGATSNVFGWPAVQPGNAGSYDVVVSNLSGAVTSAPVTLSVLPNTASCSLTNLRLTPLNELGLNTHKGYAGGLYPGGLNYRPRAHDEAGRNIARTLVFPRNFAGVADTNSGKVALVAGIGLGWLVAAPQRP